MLNCKVGQSLFRRKSFLTNVLKFQPWVYSRLNKMLGVIFVQLTVNVVFILVFSFSLKEFFLNDTFLPIKYCILFSLENYLSFFEMNYWIGLFRICFVIFQLVSQNLDIFIPLLIKGEIIRRIYKNRITLKSCSVKSRDCILLKLSLFFYIIGMQRDLKCAII